MDEHETQSKQIKPSTGLLWERLRDVESVDHITGFELPRNHLAIKKKVEELERSRKFLGIFQRQSQQNLLS